MDMCDDAQDGSSCLMSAVLLDNMDTVAHIFDAGGKELTILQNKVWLRGLVG
jgi:hypothetical protein